jgi:signal transduction histidine kinase
MLSSIERAGESLKKSEERFRLLSANIPGIVYLADHSSSYNIRFFSGSGRIPDQTFDDMAAKMKTTSLPELADIRDRNDLIDKLTHLDSDNINFHSIFRLNPDLFNRDTGKIDSSDNIYWAEMFGTFIPLAPGENGESPAIVGVIFDISEKMIQEETKRKMEQMLAKTQRLETIGTLAGGIAHDFNNILTPILGYTQIIKGKLTDEDPMADQISKVEQAARRAKNLVSQILSFSRQGDGEKALIKPSLIIKEIHRLLESTIPKNVTLNLSLITDDVFILADPTRIYQVIMNLCSNALSAMEEKGGKLGISMDLLSVSTVMAQEKGVTAGDFILISVSDDGTGIPDSVRDKIFEPFFTTKPLGKGTGLGLSVAHGIIRSHWGFIDLETSGKFGSTFYVYLLLHLRALNLTIRNQIHRLKELKK